MRPRTHACTCRYCADGSSRPTAANPAKDSQASAEKKKGQRQRARVASSARSPRRSNPGTGRPHARTPVEASGEEKKSPAGRRPGRSLSLSLSDMLWRLVAGGEASRGMRAGPRVRLRVPILPASNRAQGYAGSGGSLGLPALQYSGAG